MKPGLEVIKLEYILILKKSTMFGCFRTRVRKQPIIALYFEFKNELKLYNLEACASQGMWLKDVQSTKTDTITHS